MLYRSNIILDTLYAEILGADYVTAAFGHGEKKRTDAAAFIRCLGKSVSNDELSRFAVRASIRLNPVDRRQCILNMIALYEKQPVKPKYFVEKLKLIAKAFDIRYNELEELILVSKYDYPVSELYRFSTLVGSSKPAMVAQLDGLKFIQINNCTADFWFFKMQSSGFILLKTIKCNLKSEMIFPGSLLVLSETYKRELRLFGVSYEEISATVNRETTSLFRLNVAATDMSPAVTLDPLTPKIEISGRSIMLDAVAFYAPIFNWLNSFRYNKHTTLELNFSFDFVNTKTCRMLATLFYQCKEIEYLGVKVNYNWISPPDDADIKQIGIDMQTLIGSTFKFIETEGWYE